MLSIKVTKNIPFYTWYYHSKSYCLQKLLHNSCCLYNITSYACVTHIRPSLQRSQATFWKAAHEHIDYSLEEVKVCVNIVELYKAKRTHCKKSFVNVPLSGCVACKPIE